ncbi:MAG: hypothetical protein J6P60_06925, partial [Lachnospiraceae bacterium]|nr:hypothetical protein [Lachnospiraceae bacterium]
ARDKHPVTNGSVSTVVAYAREYDAETGAVVNESAEEYAKSVYMPSGGEPVPHGTTIGLTNTSFAVDSADDRVDFKADVSFNCTQQYRPKVEQGFGVALIGTPNADPDGKPVILTRTANDYVTMMATQTKTVELSLQLDDSLHIADYSDLYVYVWHADFGADGGVSQEFALTPEEFETYKSKKGVIADYTNGLADPKYIFLRHLGDDTNRGFSRVKVQ